MFLGLQIRKAGTEFLKILYRPRFILITPHANSSAPATLPKTKTRVKKFALKQVGLDQSEKLTERIVSCFLCSSKYAHTSFANAVQMQPIHTMILAFIHTFTVRYLAVIKISHTPAIRTNATIQPSLIPSTSPERLQTSKIVRKSHTVSHVIVSNAFLSDKTGGNSKLLITNGKSIIDSPKIVGIDHKINSPPPFN